jgi:hypothetical protein
MVLMPIFASFSLFLPWFLNVSSAAFCQLCIHSANSTNDSQLYLPWNLQCFKGNYVIVDKGYDGYCGNGGDGESCNQIYNINVTYNALT